MACSVARRMANHGGDKLRKTGLFVVKVRKTLFEENGQASRTV
jgi:hypothetical protein